MSTTITWNTSEIEAGFERYRRNCNAAKLAVARYIAPVIENYAKENATWQDQTANARQSLYTVVEEASENIVRVWLSHGVDYGLFLEIKYSGRYAIVLPALEAHEQQIMQMLRRIFNG